MKKKEVIYYEGNAFPSSVGEMVIPKYDEDLIAETKDKKYWAIQCKYRSNQKIHLPSKGI
jgi:hypothetical protein